MKRDQKKGASVNFKIFYYKCGLNSRIALYFRIFKSLTSDYKRGFISGDQITYSKLLEIRKMIGVGHTRGDLDLRELMSAKKSQVPSNGDTCGTHQKKDFNETSSFAEQCTASQDFKTINHSSLDKRNEMKSSSGQPEKSSPDLAPKESDESNLIKSINDSKLGKLLEDQYVFLSQIIHYNYVP
jgi:hypothetical protein